MSYMTDETSKEKAWKIYHLPYDDFELRVTKISNKNLLKELWLLAVQKDNNRVLKLILKQAETQNIKLTQV